MGLFDFFTKNDNNKQQNRPEFFDPNKSGMDMHVTENGRQSMATVKVFHPRSYSDVELIINHLRLDKPAIVYLHEIREDTAQRVLDLLSGAVYALNGGLYEIQKNIYIFTPDGVEVN